MKIKSIFFILIAMCLTACGSVGIGVGGGSGGVGVGAGGVVSSPVA